MLGGRRKRALKVQRVGTETSVTDDGDWRGDSLRLLLLSVRWLVQKLLLCDHHRALIVPTAVDTGPRPLGQTNHFKTVGNERRNRII